MDKISLKAPAKINLFLRVLGKRPDGYHNIESLMQAIDLYDEITLEKSDEIEISCDDSKIPNDETNLAYKAAEALRDSYYFPGVRITLIKHIPSQAGLGGGSSDAAFVLRGLCQLYNLKPDIDELMGIAASLGSDVPFFLTAGQAIVSGRGEKIREVHLPTDYSVILLVPKLGFSTAEVYGKLKFNLTPANRTALFEKGIKSSNLLKLLETFSNDLEEVILRDFPELVRLKELLNQAGAVYSAMSGSGSTFFGIFHPNEGNLNQLIEQAKNNYKVVKCKPIRI